MWVYSAQVVTVIAQFGYAAITSRLVDPAGFGQYAVATTVTAMVTMVSQAVFAQAVGRLVFLDPGRIRSLASWTLLVGAVAGIAMYLSASIWASIWGAVDAISVIKWSAVGASVAPVLALVQGILARLGYFRKLGLSTTAANIVGFIIGLLAVVYFGTPEALLVSPITAQVLSVFGGWILIDRTLVGFSSLRTAWCDIRFGVKSGISSILSYFSGNITKWSVSFSLGAQAIGNWNRAEVVSTVPFYHIQSALLQAIYPEFRHDRENSLRAYKVWPDVLALVGWISMPVAAVGAVVLPEVIPIFLGPGWQLAESLSSVLALSAGIQVVSATLNKALSAIAQFRWIFVSQIVAMIFYFGCAIATVILSSWTYVTVALIGGPIVQHLVQVGMASRAGYVSVGKLAVRYLELGVASAACWYIAWLTLGVAQLVSSHPILGVGYLLTMLVTGVALWLNRLRLRPIKILDQYGLFQRFNRERA